MRRKSLAAAVAIGYVAFAFSLLSVKGPSGVQGVRSFRDRHLSPGLD